MLLLDTYINTMKIRTQQDHEIRTQLTMIIEKISDYC